ncbi:MAG: AAA family ATPase [Blastocatellia bacterium]
MLGQQGGWQDTAMIEKISIKNFKNHAHTDIDLGRVTALVGPNGSGKSTVLQTIHALNLFVEHVVKRGRLSWDIFYPLVRRHQHEWSLCVTGEQSRWQIKVAKALVESPKDTWKVNEVLLKNDDETSKEAVAEVFGQAVYFKGISSHISAPSYTLDIPPQFSAEGSGLASVLAYLMTYDRKRHLQIEQSLCAIVPTVKEVRARPALLKLKDKKVFSVNGAQIPYEEERDVTGQELIFDTLSGDEIPANAMSEGTLITLALLTVLHSSTEDARLFLLDDVEQGLHPLAQRKLMQNLKDFAKQHNRQIILTTHSPYIVDELEATDVWVMTSDKEGISHCQQLSKGPNANFALEVLTTGEFLGAEGEDWVLDPPVQEDPVHA